jgi:hypothetical protein
VDRCDNELAFMTICPSRRERSTPFLEWYMFSSSLFLVAFTVVIQINGGGSYMTSLDGGSASAVRFLGQGFISRPSVPCYSSLVSIPPACPTIPAHVFRHELIRERTANSRSIKWLQGKWTCPVQYSYSGSSITSAIGLPVMYPSTQKLDFT